LREELEDKLQRLSGTLEPFSQEDQVEFLTKFWSLKDWYPEMNSKEKEENKKKLEIYAKKLVKKLGNSISDKDREFTGIPLQTRMLAEVFDEEVKTFFQSFESTPDLRFQLDLCGLYRRFIERKYDIYQEEKLQVRVSTVAAIDKRERELKGMRNDHQLLALKVLFTEEQVTLFQSNTQYLFSARDLTQIGVMQLNYEGNLQFIHRTFAEYHVADYLVNCLTEGKNTSEQVQTFILKDIFLGEDYRLIRVFIDGLLSRCKPPTEMLEQYGNRIHVLQNVCLLHRAALEGDANIIEFILDSVTAGGHTDTVSSLLLTKDAKGRTAWEMAAIEGNIEVLEKIRERTKEKETRQKIKYDLSRDTNKQETSVRHVAADHGILDVLQKERESAKLDLKLQPNTLSVKNTERLTLRLMAIQEGKLEPLKKVWGWAKENPTPEEINNTLLATHSMGMTILHLVACWGHPNILQKTWERAKEYLTAEEIKNKLLLATDSEGYTAWHRAAEWGQLDILQSIWECAKEKLTKEELKNKLLLARDSEGNTAWHRAVKWGQLDILQLIWECAKDKLTKEELKNKLLLATNNLGNTACHLGAIFFNLDILQEIWVWNKENLTREELKYKLLLATNKNENTPFHFAAKRDKLNVLQEMWKWAKENLTMEEIKNKLLLAIDSDGNTAWHWAVEFGKLSVLQAIWEWAKEYLTTEDLKNKLLLATDSDGNTAWQKAAKWDELDLLQQIWEWSEEILTTEERKKKLLLVTDSDGNTSYLIAGKESKLDYCMN
jgi:ankyrin repeat protein